MSRRLPDLIGDYAIIQGESWNAEKHTGLAFPYGDWRSWTPSGQIRSALKDDAGELLATFSWGEPLWDEDRNITVFYPQLSALTTASLPVTKYQGNNTLSIKTALVYDIEIALNGVIKKGSFGYVQVIGEVTYESD